MCIYGVYKNGTDDPVCRAGIEIQTWRIDFGHSGGKRGWGKLRD